MLCLCAKFCASTYLTPIFESHHKVYCINRVEALESSELGFSGQVSAVAVTKGVFADIACENGVAVYTITKARLMYEASMGGQKFNFLPSEKPEEEIINETE